MTPSDSDTVRNPRVWLRAFWGFGPEEGGYLGFTARKNRDRFIDEHQANDLVLIYGADRRETKREQRRQLLGFLQVEATPIRDVDRASSTELARKKANNWTHRWTYAVPVVRAWRITQRYDVGHFARKTFATHNPSLIASRCELMVPDEASAVLRIPAVEAKVFGETVEEITSYEAPIDELVHRPSRGVVPSFGHRSFEVSDAENRLYVLRLHGDVAQFLGRPAYTVAGKVVVKVGHAKEPNDRCNTHNAHLPKACSYSWALELVSRPFAGGQEAKLAEDKLKATLEQRFESLGREFFLVEEKALNSEFLNVTAGTSRLIVAPN